MDIIRLRTLTRKSVLGFGYEGDLPIQMLLNRHRAGYLRWVYFNSSNLSFTDDILDELKVDPEFRIQKPGVQRDFHEKLNHKLYDHFALSTIEAIKRKSDHAIKGRAISALKRQCFTKDYMQATNQGHKRGRMPLIK